MILDAILIIALILCLVAWWMERLDQAGLPLVSISWDVYAYSYVTQFDCAADAVQFYAKALVEHARDDGLPQRPILVRTLMITLPFKWGLTTVEVIFR